ncbi:ribosomal biogenesis protein [Methanotorris igneus]|uniref:Probable Brix domain-containing ribosomal biogenesis protein n=1 Tax=Methanotorris igneus (strain DSM 5666 / JCM 11834 / Kol 5) TaxID=880724 RepID=F6BDE0_METIK|nr:ribosomal biogenesis protein [Methanotorris igneus]AEF96501.1 brix domain-containing ribosomal biogenesis protein [Methanotorris igneus Kol 5]
MNNMIITTSRKPSQRTRSFANDLARALNVEYLTRGKTPLREIFEYYDKVIIIEEFKGNPGKLKIYDVLRNRILSMFISIKLQKEVCGERVTNDNGLAVKYTENTKEYCNLFLDYGFEFVEDSDFVMSFEKVKYRNPPTDKNKMVLFSIQFYKNDRKVGPLIRVKSIKTFDKIDVK